MASAKQRAWRKKFAAMAKSGKFRKKSSTKRRKSTRKYQVRKTARRAYTGLKRKAKSYKRRKSSSSMKLPRIPSVVKKAAIGLGAAQLAALAVGFIAPQFAGIAKPVAALAAGGVPGVAAELVLDQGILGNVMGMFGGQANTGGVSGL
tara:strand:- start:32 stop:475 length:444 start_codon:yes stop_codon:yes gene_type:complete